MKLYLAGPMTGLPEFNFPAFFQAAADLRKAGFYVVSPAERMPLSAQTKLSWAENLKADIPLLISCDGVAVLPGWADSRGASLELHIARSLSIPYETVLDWQAMGPE